MSLLIMILSVVAVNAVLIPVDKPKGCSTSINVFNGLSYEKSLCFMKWDATYFKASETCKQRGMQLYVHNSSPASSKALNQFAKKVLKGISKAEVFISGKQAGNRCSTLRGDKTISNAPCHISYNFICEYNQKQIPMPSTVKAATTTPATTKITTTTIPTTTTMDIITYVQCDFYETDIMALSLITTDGIAEPQFCVYRLPIDQRNTVLSVTSAVAKENIAALDLAETRGTKYLPIFVNTEFPNLSYYDAYRCDIAEISKRYFEGMSKLRYLNLDSNKISSLTYGVFSELTSIDTISLSYNPITQLSSRNVFEGLNVLRVVFLEVAGCIDEIETWTAVVLPGTITHTCTLI